MNRPIKFRAWTSNNEWIYYSIQGLMDGSALGVTYHIDHRRTGQFTGRVDKNGKEIYEGDIIKQNYENEFGSFGMALGVVAYCPHHSALEAVIGDGMDRRGFTIGDDCEVVGDVYQNPEILK